MEILRKDFDHLIFDSPPSGLYADVQTIAGECGSALLIAREHHTHAHSLIELKKHLQYNGTMVIGSTLNQCQH
jgi:Mrp family chromosome partitioning ATPase